MEVGVGVWLKDLQGTSAWLPALISKKVIIWYQKSSINFD